MTDFDLPKNPIEFHRARADSRGRNGYVVLSGLKALSRWSIYGNAKTVGRLPTEADARRGMAEAKTLKEYQEWAETLDELQGHGAWKRQKHCVESGYNADVLEQHIQKLTYATTISDLGALSNHFRVNLSRNIGQMNAIGMYKHSWAGTKELIDLYISSVLKAFEAFAGAIELFDLNIQEVHYYLDSLKQSQRFFGRSALALSGGAKMGMKHIGVVKTLWEADVLPQIISGASAGSIVAAVACCSNDEDMKNTLNRFPMSDLACFDPPTTSAVGWWCERAKTLWEHGSLFRMENMERVMKAWVGNMTFREAHNKTGRILNIAISAENDNEARILNYITAPDVLIWSAVCASCSVPGVFPGADLYEKDVETQTQRLWMGAHRQFFDGSLDHDLPLRQVAEMFNVNLFIVCQVNPHVRLFTDLLGFEAPFKGRKGQAPAPWPASNLLWSSALFAKQAALHVVDSVKELGMFEHALRYSSLLQQEYTGDIDILPQIHPFELLNMLSNPSPDYMLDSTLEGEKATWPKIWRIKNMVAIETGLERTINVLQDRIHFGKEARAQREAARAARQVRSHNIRGERPAFTRKRSLSGTMAYGDDQTQRLRRVSDPPTPPPLRRNSSQGQLQMTALPSFSMTAMTGRVILSPQAGLDHLFQDSILAK